MYNKIFTKILDSSIWLEPDATRIVWLTLLAAMDQDGFAQFAGVPNLAHRAIVPVEACREALRCLEGPDLNSSDPDNEGRRIERVPGGWMVLNAEKYRELVTRVAIREQTKERVRKHRAAKPVTPCNAEAVTCNASIKNVTESDADADADTKNKIVVSDDFTRFWAVYPKKVGKDEARKAWAKKKPTLSIVLKALEQQRSWLLREDAKYCPNPATWLNQGRWQDEPPSLTVNEPVSVLEFRCPHTPTCLGRPQCDVKSRIEQAKA